MTEAEWLAFTEAYQPLIFAREVASVRKLRLVAAAYAHWLQSCPGYEDAKPCADLIERVADQPVSVAELEEELYARPDDWRLSHALGDENRVGNALSRLVWFAEVEFVQRQADPGIAHLHVQTLLHDIIGNPFQPVSPDPSWLTSTVVQLAEGIYTERAYDRLPVLVDALQDAGCENADILDHCRGPGPHVRGCWVVDLVLGES
jgi:hypothetical protein